MKNYVVYANYTIGDNPEKSATYGEMIKLSIDSCKRHLKGEYEIMVLSGLVADHQEVFRRNWTVIDELWHREPCNILFIDTDTVFLNDVDIFGRFTKFTLFNYTDPKGDLNGHPYFNCGVRYYPNSMNPTLWEEYRMMGYRWPENAVWDYEQQCLNQLLWNPLNNTSFEECYHPEIVYQTPWGLDANTNEWNGGVNWLEAGIIHYHGSRGNERLGLAQQILAIRSTIV